MTSTAPDPEPAGRHRRGKGEPRPGTRGERFAATWRREVTDFWRDLWHLVRRGRPRP